MPNCTTVVQIANNLSEPKIRLSVYYFKIYSQWRIRPLEPATVMHRGITVLCIIIKYIIANNDKYSEFLWRNRIIQKIFILDYRNIKKAGAVSKNKVNC